MEMYFTYRGRLAILNNVVVPGGVGPETNQAMKNIQSVLERNGSSMDNIIKCTCMLVLILMTGPQ
jgi:2-iminobutanoate/2-iminopropanoate deaminase